jgi:uncharacterized membrane protein
MNIQRFGSMLAAFGVAVAVIGFILAEDSTTDPALAVGHAVGGWLGVALAVVGVCVFMNARRP